MDTPATTGSAHPVAPTPPGTAAGVVAGVEGAPIGAPSDAPVAVQVPVDATATAPGVPQHNGPAADSHERVDVALVRRGLARSRTHAAKLVAAGRVRSGAVVVTRPSRPVEPSDDLVVATGPDDEPSGEVDWVSRGGVKLDRALGALATAFPPGVVVTGRRCLDAGASTGGFTEVLLRRGAATVVAVDVGHDQLAPSLRADPRVDDREGVSVRELTAAEVDGPVDLLVADLSFISLRTVLADLVGLVGPDGELVVMVKPQFEVGRARLPRGGVVRDVAGRVDAVLGVAATARELGGRSGARRPASCPDLRATWSSSSGSGGRLPIGADLPGAAAIASERAVGVDDDRLTTMVREAE